MHDLFIMQRNYPVLKPIYLDAKKLHSNLLKSAKFTHTQNSIMGAANQSKAAWQVINQSDDKHKAIELICDGVTYSDPNIIANAFNDYFISEPLRLVNAKRWNARDVGTVSSFERSFFCAPYTEYEMMQIVNKLKPKRSWGFDGVPDFVMRSVGSCIVKPLTYIINISFETGIFPAKLKLSVVTPIFKRDDPADVSNYRPVSLLSCFHKVIELCMYDRLMKFLEHYNILSACQHGFSAKHSTTTLIHHFYHKRRASSGSFC